LPKGLDYRTFEERVEREGLVYEMKEQFEQALNAYDRLLAEVEGFSPSSQPESNEKDAILAYLLMRKSGILLQTGKMELGEQLMHQAVEHAEKSGNSLVIARAKLGVGVFYGSTGRLEEGAQLLEAALLSFGKGADYDSKQGYGWALLNLGGLYRKQGKLVQAEKRLLDAIGILEGIGNWVGVASAYELKAQVSRDKDDAGLAKEDLLNAISFYEKQGMTEKASSLRKNLQAKST
jgi:tetratricopeptide (TPR) repeat protein